MRHLVLALATASTVSLLAPMGSANAFSLSLDSFQDEHHAFGMGLFVASDGSYVYDPSTTAWTVSDDSNGTLEEIFGGDRNILIEGGDGVSSSASDGAFTLALDAATAGGLTLTYDGIDGAGLGDLDLTAGGLEGAFSYNLDSLDHATDYVFKVSVYTDDDNYSELVHRLLKPGESATSSDGVVIDLFEDFANVGDDGVSRIKDQAFEFDFDQFRSASGSGADFSRVNAVSVSVSGYELDTKISQVTFSRETPEELTEPVEVPESNMALGAALLGAAGIFSFRRRRNH